MKLGRTELIFLLLFASLVMLGPCSGPLSPPVAPATLTQVTYFYEKDEGSTPREIDYSLNWMSDNIEGILASTFQRGQPESKEYEAALAAIEADDWPCLVAERGDHQIWKVLKNPSKIAQLNEQLGLTIPEPE